MARVSAALAEYGVEPYPADCIPPELTGQLAIFVAPQGMSFEGDDVNATEAVGPARVTSTHGLRPGLPGDDRFAVFAGPDVVPGVVDEGHAVQVAPTLAAILGLSLDPFPAVSLFDNVRAVIRRALRHRLVGRLSRMKQAAIVYPAAGDSGLRYSYASYAHGNTR